MYVLLTFDLRITIHHHDALSLLYAKSNAFRRRWWHITNHIRAKLYSLSIYFVKNCLVTCFCDISVGNFLVHELHVCLQDQRCGIMLVSQFMESFEPILVYQGQ